MVLNLERVLSVTKCCFAPIWMTKIFLSYNHMNYNLNLCSKQTQLMSYLSES